uniref:Uncharacterized protein n=1 Tax=viral metagenome TaxID=1070528 RepID=A0A6M3JTG0_9ZZZZ
MTVSNAYNGSFATFTKCASNDATGSEAGLQNIAHNTTQFTSVTDPHDYRLPGTGSALYNTGTDGPFAAPLDYTTDIQGDTRTSTWDIGADEYVAAGGGLTAALADSNTISDALGGFLTYRASIGDDANA